MRFWMLALAIPAGCSWFSTAIEVGVRLPDIPEHWRRAFPELRFQLTCPEADVLQAEVLPDGLATLRLPKRTNWPLLAYPWARGVRLPPAGGLFPMDLASEGDSLELSWEHGAAAEILQALVREGFDIACVNARRLVDEMLARSGGDPACLNLQSLADCLASGDFRVTDIRPLPVREIRLEVPPGTWFLESPFRPAQSLAAGQALLIPAVPLGPHRLFAAEQPEGFDLFVGEREVLLLPFSP